MRGLVVVSLGALLLGACDDGPICQSDVFIAVQTSQIASDVDTTAPGVQADITVRTSVAEGEVVVLEVQDRDGVLAERLEATVDARGDATFRAVTVTEPRTILRASVDTACGANANEVAVDVFASSACQLALSPEPAPNAHYAPIPVLTTRTDPDPLAAGYQIAATITSRPGWLVELVQSTATGDRVLATTIADRSGIARTQQTLADGLAVLRATCREPASTLAAASLANVEGEPTALVYQQTLGGPPVSATTTAVDASGGMTAVAALAPATTPASFTFGLVAQDHAGNQCLVEQTFEVDYAACDLAVVAPTTYVTRDASGAAGSQVDLALEASGACINRSVTGSCGTSTLSGTVRADGTLTLRATVCGTVPCETDTICTFEVTTAGGTRTRTVSRVMFDNQPPTVFVELAAPGLPCGATISSASDLDPAAAGMQIAVRVVAGGALTRHLELTNGAGASTVVVVDDLHVVTIASGINRLVGIAFDAAGNRGRSTACNVHLVN